jgi:hypothetical protein
MGLNLMRMGVSSSRPGSPEPPSGECPRYGAQWAGDEDAEEAAQVAPDPRRAEHEE